MSSYAGSSAGMSAKKEALSSSCETACLVTFTGKGSTSRTMRVNMFLSNDILFGVVARTTGNADDWSDDDGVHPDPDARWGIHGLGYRRGFDQ